MSVGGRGRGGPSAYRKKNAAVYMYPFLHLYGRFVHSGNRYVFPTVGY